MELIKFDGDYINTRHIIAIQAPKQIASDCWSIELKTDATQYPYFVWNFSTQFEAEREFKKLVSDYR